jgi:hypothetical protein
MNGLSSAGTKRGSFVTEIRVASWGELQEVLFADSWIEELGRHRSRCAYRGLSDATYSLQTTLMRMGGRFAPLTKNPKAGRWRDEPGVADVAGTCFGYFDFHTSKRAINEIP